MSSKIYPADSSRATPMAWRTVPLLPRKRNQDLPRSAPEPACPSNDREQQLQQKLQEAHAAGVQEGHAAGVREGHAAGLREGETAGRNRAAAELQPVLDRLARSIEELAGLRARLRREAESDLVRLALAIAQRILRRELAVDPDAMHGLILGALEKLKSQDICRVRVHPNHVSLLSQCIEQHSGARPPEVIADPSREPGSVVFETEGGSLDASVASQLREIERGLVDRLRNSK